MPLLVATVFGATFFVVCAVAWVLLGRNTSAAPAPPSPSPFDAPRPASFEIHSIGSTPAHEVAAVDDVGAAPPSASATASDASPLTTAKASNQTTLRFYRLLMFATGVTGMVASALMFSAVTEISRLLFVAAAIFLGSCLALYRGFVPDPELTGKR